MECLVHEAGGATRHFLASGSPLRRGTVGVGAAAAGRDERRGHHRGRGQDGEPDRPQLRLRGRQVRPPSVDQSTDPSPPAT